MRVSSEPQSLTATAPLVSTENEWADLQQSLLISLNSAFYIVKRYFCGNYVFPRTSLDVFKFFKEKF